MTRRVTKQAEPARETLGIVAEIVPVLDAEDSRLADYVRLTDVNLRKSLEAAHGLFVAEGEKVIRRALATGYPLRSILITERRLAALADLVDSCAAPAFVVPARWPSG